MRRQGILLLGFIGGEVPKARLCRQERGLVSVLTVLARARVDAADGQWLDGGRGG